MKKLLGKVDLRNTYSVYEEDGAYNVVGENPRGQRCHRVIFSAWWYERTGWIIPELSNDGELLGLEQLHHQVLPLRPR